MSDCSNKLLEELKKRAIFSEYLPENFNVKSENFDVYSAGGSNKDNIEPYQFNMSRLNNTTLQLFQKRITYRITFVL